MVAEIGAAAMLNQSRLAEIGALIGDPGRANMLDALMDGRALTARELAGVAGVAPQTASGHLSKLIEAGLIGTQQHGRHRYHRLASAEVAHLLQNIAHFAARPKGGGSHAVRTGPRDAAVRLARTCYTNFAGRLGVSVADAMLARGQIELDQDGGTVTEPGRDFLSVSASRSRRRGASAACSAVPASIGASAVRILAARWA